MKSLRHTWLLLLVTAVAFMIGRATAEPFGLQQPVLASDIQPVPDATRQTATEERIIQTSSRLQGCYIDLCLIRSSRMSEQELKVAISEMKTALKSLDERANAALTAVQNSLHHVVKQFPGTEAAEKASKALDDLNPSVPTIPRKRFMPGSPVTP